VRQPQDQNSSEPQAFNVLGVRVQFLSTPEQIHDNISLMRGAVAPGVVIPLHSHPDPEIIHVTAGAIEIFQADGPHAGFRELAQPFDPSQLPAPSTRQDRQKLLIAAERYQYWLASPEENAAIGIAL
jgi:anti-sigma factor ChrR (cupin superfamily)